MDLPVPLSTSVTFLVAWSVYYNIVNQFQVQEMCTGLLMSMEGVLNPPDFEIRIWEKRGGAATWREIEFQVPKQWVLPQEVRARKV